MLKESMADEQNSDKSMSAAELFLTLFRSESEESNLAEHVDFEKLRSLALVQQGTKLSSDLSWLNETPPQWKVSLEASTIQDVYLRVWQEGLNGYLVCKDQERLKVLLFSKGEFHSIRSNIEEEQLLSFLLQENVLTKEQIQSARDVSTASGNPFLWALLAEEHLGASEVFLAVKKNQLETMAELFAWQSGECFFYRQEELENKPIAIAVSFLELVRDAHQKKLREQSFLLRQVEMDLLSSKNYIELSEQAKDFLVQFNAKEIEVLKGIGQGLSTKEIVQIAPVDTQQEREQFFSAFSVLYSVGLIKSVESLSDRRVHFLAEEFSDAEVNEMYDDILGVAKRDEIIKSAVNETALEQSSETVSEVAGASDTQVNNRFDSQFDMRLMLMAFAGLALCLVQGGFAGDMIYGGYGAPFFIRRSFLFWFGLLGVIMCADRPLEDAWPVFKEMGWKGPPLGLLIAILMGAGCSYYTFNAYAIDFPWYAIAWVPWVVLCEEVFFRGYLFAMFERLLGDALGACFLVAICNSFYFLSFHFVTEQDVMRQLFRFGVSFISFSLPVCLCYFKTRSLLVSSFFHMALRLVVLSREF